MAMREIDVDGLLWTVWEVHPTLEVSDGGAALSEGLAGGWLSIRFGHRKRRIAPVPEGWEGWSDEALAEAVRGAPPVRGSE